MKVLVTGSRGEVGRAVVSSLRSACHEVSEFDLQLGHDIRSRRQVSPAVGDVDAVVHLAAVTTAARWDDALATNVLGSDHLLGACVQAGVRRIVNISSLNATGAFLGRRAPAWFPIDENLPCVPDLPYSASKLIVEQLCDRYARIAPELSIVSLRLPAVWLPERYDRERARWASDPARQWKPFWEFGAFIDIADACAVVEAALQASPVGHHVLNSTSCDAANLWPTMALVERLHPDVPWRSPQDRERCREDAFSTLVDLSAVKSVLGWEPACSFHRPEDRVSRLSIPPRAAPRSRFPRRRRRPR